MVHLSAPGLLGVGLALLTTSPVTAAERLIARSHSRSPEWLGKPPADTGGASFFVGTEGHADSIEAGREAAFKDAARQVADFIETRVSASLVARRTEVEGRVLDEIRAASRGDLRGGRVKEVYWERYSAGSWPRGGVFYRSWVLVSFPNKQVQEERQRLQGLEGQFESRLGDLCQAAAAWIGEKAPGQTTAIAGFREAASNRRYAFSRVLEGHLSGCLTAVGVKVVQAKGHSLVLAGTYLRLGDAVLVSATLTRMEDGARVFAKAVSIPQDAIVPDWLTVEQPKQEPFFAGLERWETQKRLAVGRLSVDSKPRGARIFLDGEDRGKTPTDLPEVAVGVHAVALALDGYVIHIEKARVDAEETATVDVELKEKVGKVDVRSSPPGAAVVVDGRVMGTTPTLLSLPATPHVILLRHKDCRDKKVSVAVIQGQTLALNEELEQDPGGLAFMSDPMGAKVYLDDDTEPRGKTPLRLAQVEAGWHKVNVAKTDYGTWTDRVMVSPNAFSSVAATLKKAKGGQILLRVSPGDADLSIDHEPRPEFSGIGLYALPAGEHVVKLSKDGYRTWEMKVSLENGGFVPLRADLEAVAYSAAGQELDSRGSGSAGRGSGELMPVLMPWTTEFMAICRRDFLPGAGRVAGCGGKLLLEGTLSVGLYPIGIDLLGLPFRGLGMAYRRLRGNDDAAEGH